MFFIIVKWKMKGRDSKSGKNSGNSSGKESKSKSKLAEIQRENAECVMLMKTFCLSPTIAVYEHVNRCGVVTRSDFYATWKVFLPQYCADETGGTTDNGDGGEKKKDLYNMKRDIAFRALILKASEAPTKSVAMQLLYVFAATGWFPAIEKFYECVGDGRIVRTTRIELSQEYKEWKELYVSRVHELLTADPTHFTSRGIDKTAVDFSRFEVYQREYERRKNETL